MSEYELEIEVFIDSEWVLLGKMEFLDECRRCRLTYDRDYVVSHFDEDDNHAVSINYPPTAYAHFFDVQPKFIDDMIPSGASRRYWLSMMDMDGLTSNEINYVLLKYATISPVGNLRVKDALSLIEGYVDSQPLFDVSDVISRSSDFLEYASERGGVAGGATGAGGEAPKLLVRRGVDNKVWIDPLQNGLFRNNDGYYLVKFPRGSRTSRDKDVLIAEYHFYHELTSMGVFTIDVNGMRLEFNEENGEPSLWLPRFDIFKNEDITSRYSIQSIYSILGKGSGAYLNHEETIRQLIDVIESSSMYIKNNSIFNRSEFVAEWISRDILNVAFGNADNHGRNTSFLSFDGQFFLSPVYDFAPMKADPDAIARTTKWDSQFESGSNINYAGIIDSISHDCSVDRDLIRYRVESLAERLVGLYDRLKSRGVPESILDYPSIGFATLDNKLKRWGVL